MLNDDGADRCDDPALDVQKKILTFGLILTLAGRLLCPKDYLKVYRWVEYSLLTSLSMV